MKKRRLARPLVRSSVGATSGLFPSKCMKSCTDRKESRNNSNISNIRNRKKVDLLDWLFDLRWRWLFSLCLRPRKSRRLRRANTKPKLSGESSNSGSNTLSNQRGQLPSAGLSFTREHHRYSHLNSVMITMVIVDFLCLSQLCLSACLYVCLFLSLSLTPTTRRKVDFWRRATTRPGYMSLVHLSGC